MKLRSIIFAFLVLSNLLCAMEGATQNPIVVVEASLVAVKNTETMPSAELRAVECLIAPVVNHSDALTNVNNADALTNISAISASGKASIHGCDLQICSLVNCPEQNVFRITCRISPPSAEYTTNSPHAIKRIIYAPHNSQYTVNLGLLDRENQNSPWHGLFLVLKNNIQQLGQK